MVEVDEDEPRGETRRVVVAAEALQELLLAVFPYTAPGAARTAFSRRRKTASSTIPSTAPLMTGSGVPIYSAKSMICSA